MTEKRSNRFRPVTGLLTASLLMLAAAGCAGSAATVDTRSESGGTAMFAGTWAGTFEVTDFSGDMGVTLAFEEGSWTGTVTASAMGETFTSELENFESEGAGFTFYTFMADGDIYFKGMVEGEKMSGTFQVFVEGNMQDEGVFTFTKK